MNLNQLVEVPDNVLVRVIDGEAVVLNLDTEEYFGLDEMGTEFWTALTKHDVASSIDLLLAEFDVQRDQLIVDLTSFLESLVDRGLITLVPQQQS